MNVALSDGPSPVADIAVLGLLAVTKIIYVAEQFATIFTVFRVGSLSY